MRRKQHAVDVAMAGALAVLGLGMAIHSVSYRILVEGGRIGPGFLPFVAGLALTAFAVWAATETVLRARRAPAPLPPQPHRPSRSSQPQPARPGERPPAPPPSAPPDARLNRKVGLVFLLLLGATLLTTVTGFLLAFGLLILVLMVTVEREPAPLAAVVATAAVAVSWLVFVRLLGVPLPGGLLGLLGGG